MSDTGTAPPPDPARKHFDLYFLVDHKRYFWSNPNCGVTLTGAGDGAQIAWRAEEREYTRQLRDITLVNLQSASDGKSLVNHCRLQFRDWRELTVTDGNAAGTVDDDRTPAYRDFVRALHRALAPMASGVSFYAGVSEARHTFMQVIAVIAALFFIGVPLVLLFFIREWQVLGVLAAGAGFVWPFWGLVEKNRPRSYDPRRPPGEMME